MQSKWKYNAEEAHCIAGCGHEQYTHYCTVTEHVRKMCLFTLNVLFGERGGLLLAQEDRRFIIIYKCYLQSNYKISILNPAKKKKRK
jgi:hypothetical protein